MKRSYLNRSLYVAVLFAVYHYILVELTSVALIALSEEMHESNPDINISTNTHYLKREVAVQLTGKGISEKVYVYPNYLVNGATIKLGKLDYSKNPFLKVSSGPISLYLKTQPFGLAIPFLRKNFQVDLKIDDLDIFIDAKKLSLGRAILSPQIKNLFRSQILNLAISSLDPTSTKVEKFNLFNSFAADKISSSFLSKKHELSGQFNIKSLNTLIDITKNLNLQQKLALLLNKKALSTLLKAYPVDLEISAKTTSSILQLLNMDDKLSRPIQTSLTIKSTSPVATGKTSTDITLTPNKTFITTQVTKYNKYTILNQKLFTEISNAYINLFNPLPRKLFKVELDHSKLKTVEQKSKVKFDTKPDLSSIENINVSTKLNHTHLDKSRKFLNLSAKLEKFEQPKTWYIVVNGNPFQLAFNNKKIRAMPRDAVTIASLTTNLDTNQHPYLIVLNHAVPNQEPFKSAELKAAY